MQNEVEKMNGTVSMQVLASDSTDIRQSQLAPQSSTLLDMSTSSKRDAYKNMRRMKEVILKAPPPRARPESSSLQSAESDFV